MAAAAQVQGWDQASRRRGSRYRVQAPVDVTVLRSGIPDTLPGRSVNIGERGIAAVLAGELMAGEAVGVEFRLPSANLLRARAVVRHHDKLRSGLEFIGLSAEQREALRTWPGSVKAEAEIGERPRASVIEESMIKESMIEKSGIEKTTIEDSIEEKTEEKIPTIEAVGPRDAPDRKRRGRRWIVVPALAAMLVVGFWWKWNRGWKDLESGLPRDEVIAERQATPVPAEVMERLVTHRVDPEYPAAARRQQLRGVVAMEMVVGRDGSVVSLRPLNGPEVFAQAATEALRWWRFQPYQVNGKPVIVKTEVAVEFKP